MKKSGLMLFVIILMFSSPFSVIAQESIQCDYYSCVEYCDVVTGGAGSYAASSVECYTPTHISATYLGSSFEECLVMEDCHCDNDNDCDGILDAEDNCPDTYNADQLDSDADGYGDVCDLCPSEPLVPVLFDYDSDSDGVGDFCDNCIHTPNPGQADVDTDNVGDACDVNTLAGYVLQADDGAPLAGIEIEISKISCAAYTPIDMVLTDEKGYYAFAGSNLNDNETMNYMIQPIIPEDKPDCYFMPGVYFNLIIPVPESEIRYYDFTLTCPVE